MSKNGNQKDAAHHAHEDDEVVDECIDKCRNFEKFKVDDRFGDSLFNLDKQPEKHDNRKVAKHAEC